MLEERRMKSADQSTRSRMSRWAVAAAVLLVLACLGYAWYDYRFPSWKEEVLLPDGRKVVVKERRDFIEGYGTPSAWCVNLVDGAWGKSVRMTSFRCPSELISRSELRRRSTGQEAQATSLHLNDYYQQQEDPWPL